MSDFPVARFHKPVITPDAPEALGGAMSVFAPAAAASGGWPANNRAIFIPFTLAAPYLVQKLWWLNGSAVSGNVDCGIYTVDGTLIVAAGSTAQASTNVIQTVTSAATGTLPMLLMAGSYYMALAASTTSATFFTHTSQSVRAQQICGMAQQASALALPATFTLAASATAYIPIFGICSATVI